MYKLHVMAFNRKSSKAETLGKWETYDKWKQNIKIWNVEKLPEQPHEQFQFRSWDWAEVTVQEGTIRLTSFVYVQRIHDETYEKAEHEEQW